MNNKSLSERQEIKINTDREMQVCKRNDMLQKGRHELSLQEQRCVIYAISKIKPEDSIFQAYTFKLSDFFNVCGMQKDSYSEIKDILKKLSDKSWWIAVDDKGTESLVRWFSTLKFNRTNGTVLVKFHEDMMPYLLELSRQDTFYSSYCIKYILPMKSQYSIKLYELLKTYKNTGRWFFEVEELKKRLNCEQYENFKDFRRRVIIPSVEEINKFTDLKISWVPVKEGRKVVRVDFRMSDKEKTELLDADQAISIALDG